MKNIKYFLILFLMLFIITPVSAKEINHFYAETDDDIVLKDTVTASAIIAGNKVNTEGEIDGILFGAGTDVNISGEVAYAAIAGESVDFSGEVLKDAAIAGSTIDIKDATFQRDVAMAANSLTISGTFNRNVTAVSTTVEINDATILGNLKLNCTSVKIGNNVTIEGTLSYPEDAEVDISDNANIAKTKKTEAINEETSYTEILTQKVTSYLGLLIVFAVLSLFAVSWFTKTDEKYKKLSFDKVIELFTKGLLILILVPILAILLLITSIGVPLAVIMLLLYGIVIYISKIFAAYLIGSKIADKWMKSDTEVIIKGVIGIAIIFIISIIPYVNTICIPIIVLIGIGILFDVIRNK